MTLTTKRNGRAAAGEAERLNPQPGHIYPAIPIQDYHRGPGISASQVVDWIKTAPAYWRQDQDSPKPPTEAMIFGDLVHVLTLQPERLAACYVVEPEEVAGEPLNKRKPAHREHLALWRETLPEGVREVSRSDMNDAMLVAGALLANEFFRQLVGQEPQVEHSFYWTDAATGLLCKTRPDVRTSMLIDIKTTRDSTPDGFSRQAANLGYHAKAAWYMDGVEATTGQRPEGFAWIAIQRDRLIPEFYFAEAGQLILGRQEYRKALDEIADCMAADRWPSATNDRLTPLPLPSWKAREIELEEVA